MHPGWRVASKDTLIAPLFALREEENGRRTLAPGNLAEVPPTPISDDGLSRMCVSLSHTHTGKHKQTFLTLSARIRSFPEQAVRVRADASPYMWATVASVAEASGPPYFVPLSFLSPVRFCLERSSGAQLAHCGCRPRGKCGLFAAYGRVPLLLRAARKRAGRRCRCSSAPLSRAASAGLQRQRLALIPGQQQQQDTFVPPPHIFPSISRLFRRPFRCTRSRTNRSPSGVSNSGRLSCCALFLFLPARSVFGNFPFSPWRAPSLLA